MCIMLYNIFYRINYDLIVNSNMVESRIERQYLAPNT